MTADIHSSGLLKAEIDREQKLLIEDKTELEGLEKALRDAEAVRKRHSKGHHPLAKATTNTTARQPYGGSITKLVTKAETPTFRDLENDSNLEGLLKQVRSHLDSMQSNTASLQDISTAMTSSRAALDCFVCAGSERG